MLEIKALDTGYGKKQVLHSVSMEVRAGEIVAVIGPNGSGKSTVLKTVCGLLPVWKGQILFDGAPLNGSSPAMNISRGITFAPQGNRVFGELTVQENLETGGFHMQKNELGGRIESVLKLFPILRERIQQEAGKLSGGEQQMLAFARALIPQPKLLMLDEPSLGLSPPLIKTVFEKIVEINRETKTTILIVEQKVREVLEICNRVYSLKLGEVAFAGSPDELKGNKAKLRELFL
jgi:branched-chain amino acid transport system ATP-binding protein